MFAIVATLLTEQFMMAMDFILTTVNGESGVSDFRESGYKLFLFHCWGLNAEDFF